MRFIQGVAATLVCVAAGSCATSASPRGIAHEDGWDEALVESAGGFPILVRWGEALEVVAIEPLSVLGGTGEGRRVVEGDRIRFHVRKAVRGILVADAIHLRPALTADVARVARAEDLGEDLVDGAPTPVDVRTAASFTAAHLPGARNLPPDGAWNVARRLDLPKTTPLVFYGEDEFSAEPFDAARVAQEEGFAGVRVLQGGLRAWMRARKVTQVSPSRVLTDAGSGAVMLDVRPREEVESGAIPGSVAVPLAELRNELVSGRPWWPTLILVGQDARDPAVREALSRIRRWRGQDEIEKVQPIQILEGGYAGWLAHGGTPTHGGALAGPARLGLFQDPAVVELEDFSAAWGSAGGGRVLLDVRPGMGPDEVPPFARNIPLDQLAGRLGELPRDREIWIYCASGRRAAVAREILVRNGYRARYLKGYGPIH
jgi:rhodanese-related sulfurtransferase